MVTEKQWYDHFHHNQAEHSVQLMLKAKFYHAVTHDGDVICLTSDVSTANRMASRVRRAKVKTNIRRVS